MAKELFKPLYSPPGYKYKDAKAAGLLRTSETWWIRLYHEGRSIRESTKTDDFKKAKQFLKQRKDGLAKGEPYVKEATQTTFKDMAARLRQDFTIKGKYLRTLNVRLAHLEPAFGTRRMAALTPSDIADYITKRSGEGAANATINRDLETLARAFSLGRDLGLVTSSLRVRKHRLPDSTPRAGFFEPDAFASVLRNLTRTPNQWHAGEPALDLQCACLISYVFGWRLRSEVLTLERRHVNLAEGTLRLDPGSTKNKDGRVAYLTPALKIALQGQLERLEAFQRRTGTITPFLFVHMTGKLQGQRIKDMAHTWATACKRAGVPGMIRHDMRRTAVRNLVGAGVSETVAMKITGHRTRSVFDRYHIVSPGDLQRAAALLAENQNGPTRQGKGADAMQ